MARYLTKIKEIRAILFRTKVQQILRSENIRANRLSRLATLQIVDIDQNVHFETLEAHSINEPEAILCADLELSWMDPIINYLKHGVLPMDDLTAHKMKRLALHYVLVQEKLYKRSHTFSLLKCLPPSEADYAMREVHEGIYGNHLGG